MTDKKRFNLKDFEESSPNMPSSNKIISEMLNSAKGCVSNGAVMDLGLNCEINSSQLKINHKQINNIREYNKNSCHNSGDDVLVLHNTQKHDANEHIVIDNMIKSIIEEKVGAWIEGHLSQIVEQTAQKLVKEKLLHMKNDTLDL